MTGLYPRIPIEALPRQSKVNGAAFVGSTFVAGAPYSVQIDRLGDLIGVDLRLAGSVDTGATPGTPAARRRNPINLLGSTLTLSINGQPEFVAHPDLIYLRSMWRRGKLVQLARDSLTTAELANGSTNYDFSLQLPLDFMVDSIVPAAVGILFGEGRSSPASIELKGTWGTVSDLMTSPGATQTVNAATGLSLDKTIVFNKRGGRDGFDALQAKFGFGHYQLSQPGGKDIASTGARSFSLDVPGGRAYCAFYFRVTAGSTPVVSDAPITYAGGYLRIKRGTEVLFERLLTALINDTASGLPGYNVQTGAAEDRTGWLVVDALKGFRPEALAVMSRMMLSGNGQPLTIEIDCTTSTGAHIDVMTEELIDPESSAARRYSKVR